MILRHEQSPVDGQPIENTFIVMDRRSGRFLGASVVYTDHNATLYPVRPLQVRIQFEEAAGIPIPDRLMGASLARAQQICDLSGSFSRIYVRCAPDNAELLSLLQDFGFTDDDGLVRMQLKLPVRHDVKPPAGCTIVYDDLSDPLEKKYFLERYNQLFNTTHGMDWLNDYIDRRDFTRILAVSQSGLAGEILIWRESYSGIIGYIHTAKRWRHLGVASYLISLACEAFSKKDLFYAEANIRTSYPHMLHLMNRMGFSQSELLMRYPGINVNPR